MGAIHRVLAAAAEAGSPDFGRVFYDDFEYAGTVPFTIPTTKWAQDDANPLPTIVSVAQDSGGGGPFAGSKMARCNTTTGNNGETITIPTSDYTDELFIRLRFRLDANFNVTTGSPAKFIRIFYWNGTIYRDLYGTVGQFGGTTGVSNAGAWCDDGTPVSLSTYWGDNGSDASLDPGGSWHKIEYYFKHSTGQIKVWHDGLLVRNDSGIGFGSAKWTPFYLTSNWEDAHTSSDYYFDEVEVFSDNGAGGSGLMSDATVSA